MSGNNLLKGPIPVAQDANVVDTGIGKNPMPNQFKAPELITEEIFLPSKGLIYPNFSGHLKLRAMTTIEERMRLSGENFWETMCDILDRCICNDPSDTIEARELVDFDMFAAMVKLRIISYGPNYKYNAMCPACKKAHMVDIPLDTLDVTSLPDDFSEPFNIGPLPKTKDTLGVRFLRIIDYINIEKQITKMKADGVQMLGDMNYTLQMEKQIMTINNEPVDAYNVKRYVESMIGMDSNYYHRKLEDIFYGVHRIGVMPCPGKDCGNPLIYQISTDSEFFRPSLDD